VQSGLKYSTIKSVTLDALDVPQNIVVEVLSSENIHVPIAKEGKMFPSPDYLKFIVKNTNSALVRAREKLDRFLVNLD
jgi:tRNA(Phe) wybutosine-synthesizing methylase Tyw3